MRRVVITGLGRGEGDFDPAISKRIETGLIAIEAHKRLQSGGKTASASAINKAPLSWAAQIGAFKSRAQTDIILGKALNKLPKKYAGAVPVIAPLKTDDGWIFRARLVGMTKIEAQNTCSLFEDCVLVPFR